MRADKINNVDYLVRFRHILPDPSIGEKGGTWCYIKIADPAVEKEENLKLKSVGFTTLHVDEHGRYDRSLGRRRAFAYALGMRKDIEFKDHLYKIKLITPILSLLARQIGGPLSRRIKDLINDLSEYTKTPVYNDLFTREERTQFWKAYNEHCKSNKLTLKESKKLLAEFVEGVTEDWTMSDLLKDILVKYPYLDKSKKEKGASQ